jgi:hypothetical protein
MRLVFLTYILCEDAETLVVARTLMLLDQAVVLNKTQLVLSYSGVVPWSLSSLREGSLSH